MEETVLDLINQAEELYQSNECKKKVIKDAALIQNLKENKISSTDYQSALDILSEILTRKYPIES